MNRYTRFGWMVLLSLGLLSLGACGGVLPSKQSTTHSPWKSFDQAKASYDQIVPGETRMTDLTQIGFDPMHTPNMRRLNYLELMEMFIPNASVQRSDLDPALRGCLEVRDACYAYEVRPGMTWNKRNGNPALDIFGFRRQTSTTGWQFSSLIVVNEDTVAYKLWSGEPNIQREDSEKKPLGPLQNSGEKIIEQAVGF